MRGVNRTGRIRGSVEQRFWRRVAKGDGCWLWQGPPTGVGYGQINSGTDRRPVLVHRLSYELNVGPIPEGLFVCHHCDNRLCVNPAHLFLGTALDNAQDMVVKGRKTHPNWGKTHCKYGHEFTPENTRIASLGNGRTQRCCRTCARNRYYETLHSEGVI